jgi:hypothetical protein
VVHRLEKLTCSEINDLTTNWVEPTLTKTNQLNYQYIQVQKSVTISTKEKIDSPHSTMR